jgi:hypothetical protein
MKYEIHLWGKSHLKSGLIVCKRPTGLRDADPAVAFDPNGHTAKWTYMLSWFTDSANDPRNTVVSLSDGMIHGRMTADEVVGWLNYNDMMPMPKEWVIATMGWLHNKHW